MTDQYLTTRELAALLRIKERKVYDLAASGEIPCTRALGKLLFPRAAVNAWLAEASSGFSPAPGPARPNVFLGSHDPLLDWALRESGAGMATFFDGSFDGLDRFERGEGAATGLHVHEPEDGWNVETVRGRFGASPVVLVEWAWRERGLIVAPDAKKPVDGIAALKGRRVAPRQAGAGSQALLDHLLAEAGLGNGDVILTAPARSEADAALAVLEGKADAALGLRALAGQYRLGFVPVTRERFDLLVDRRAWFEPPLQAFFAFCRGGAFRRRAGEMAGYDTSGFGAVHFNGG